MSRALISLAIAILPCTALHGQERVVVKPADNGAALVNPDMGWTMHFYSNIISNYGSRLAPADTLDDFPGLSTVYLRLPWSFLEPSEGEFDWSVVDTPAQRWIAKGKQVAFRISCSESWMRYATPAWVQQAGAQGHNFTVGKGVDPDGPFWEPVYDDPVFLDKLDRFLREFARRYDGNPNVAFIDVGSYGVWGEGHTLASSRLEVDDKVILQHIALYRKHFPRTLLAVSDDVVGHNRPITHHPITDAMLARGVTLRDDSICVQPAPRSWYHADLAASFWPKLPVILEHEHYGSSVKKKAWEGGRLLLQAVEEYHASYLSIHWWPHEFLRQNRATIEKINMRLGYRLQLRQLSWPGEIGLGKPFSIRSTWANAGVAPCYPGGYSALTFKDADGGIVSVHVQDRLNLRDLKTAPADAAPEQTVETTCTMARVYRDGPRKFARAAAAGTYEVYISVGLLDGSPRIALPLDQDDGQHRYRMGTIVVAE